MKRREFLQSAAALAITALNPLPGNLYGREQSQPIKLPAPGPEAKVCLAGTMKAAAAKDIQSAVRKAALAATDFSWLSKGDTVFIKTVNNSGNPYPATTSPLAVSAMIGLLREKGARRIIAGDMSGVQFVRFTANSVKGSTRKLMEQAGLARAVLGAGAELHCFEEAGWKAFYEDEPAARKYWKGPIMMPAILKEVDHIILMPRCSRHMLAGSTLGLKAAVGYWRHDTRLEYHHEASTLHEKTAEANTVKTLREKQRLVITAADKILATIGPDDGFVYEPDQGLVIASESAVAHEMISLAWLLENRMHMPDSEKDGFNDTSPFIAKIVNRVVNYFLAGTGKAITAESLRKNDVARIWDDRVLVHACKITGGAPKAILQPANKTIPGDLRKRLGEMTALG
jgi:uncharacterized protein (DUF362 family)